jgi:non-heme chloroperoxidase
MLTTTKLAEMLVACAMLVATEVCASSSQSASWKDPSSHTVRFVTVEEGVRLEVLDWGGTGRPVVLLAGGGNTAHVFDDLAPKLAVDHHVYGITRRGFGASGYSPSINASDRLRDDVLAVLDALALDRPVLVGHSIAGAELSAVANSRPGRVAAFIYLDAAYPYAFDNGKGPKMAEFQIPGPKFPVPAEANLVSFSSLQKWDAEIFGYARPEAELRQKWETDPSGRPLKRRRSPGDAAFAAILANGNAYPRIPVPALVILALPRALDKWVTTSKDPGTLEAAKTYYAAIDAATERQAKAIEDGAPSARVIRMRAAHDVFLSNEAETLRAVRAFLADLQ